MRYDSSELPDHRLTEAEDDESVMPWRVARLGTLGLLGIEREEIFNLQARRILEQFDGTVAVVNLFDDQHQNYVGLAVNMDKVPRGVRPEFNPDPNEHFDPATFMRLPKDIGWCPHTIQRSKAFPLDNVNDYPRFRGGMLVDKLGVESYLGAPLIDHDTGKNIGTVCVVDTVVRQWGNQGVTGIKAHGSDVMDTIYDRAASRGLLLP